MRRWQVPVLAVARGVEMRQDRRGPGEEMFGGEIDAQQGWAYRDINCQASSAS
jgi:hypothetical protein